MALRKNKLTSSHASRKTKRTSSPVIAKTSSPKVIISKVTGNPVDPKRSRAARKAAITRKANATINKQSKLLKLHHKLIAGTAIIAVLVFILIGISNQIQTYAASMATGSFKGLDGKCLDNRYSVAHDNNRIQLYRCNNTGAQKWTLTSQGFLKSNNGGGNYCLDITHGSKAEYTYVQLYQCNGSAAQKFAVTNHQLVSKLTGYCVTVQHASTGDGTRLWVKQCHGSDAQKWSFSGSTATVNGGKTSGGTSTGTSGSSTGGSSSSSTGSSSSGSSSSSAGSNAASYSFNDIVNATKTNTMLKLNNGTYNLKDFSYASNYGAYAKAITGINGNGPDNTVIQMAPNSSTKAGSVPTTKWTTNQYYIMRVDGSPVLSNLTIRGTNQNHVYNGLFIYHTTNASLSNVKVSAIPGNSNYPPGETFAINDYYGNNSTYNNVAIDGAGVGASGFGLNSTSGGTWNNSSSSNNRYSAGWTFWQQTNGATINNSVVTNNHAGINFERATGTFHLNNVTFGGNASDISGGNDQSNDFKVIVNNPVFVNGQTKLKVNWFNGEAGGSNLYKKSDIQVFVNGVDKTSSIVQWLGVGAG